MEKHELNLFNTMTRKKELFKPINDELVTFYSCGQTVYEDVHIGNAKTYVVWDLLYRTLLHFGYDVKHVQNFTDVGHLTDDADAGEDKIIKKAKQTASHPMELVDKQIREYHQVMDAINVHRPQVAPRATGHISEMIELVEELYDKGYAYEFDGSLYFDTGKLNDYGKLAKLDVEGQQTGVRKEVKIIEGKKSPSDFALWIKAPPEHIMKYVSPKMLPHLGYPGWHLECSVMAMKYLGDTIDIHAGGVDHIPVHHTNEIAQSESATGQTFANYWLHSAFITLNNDKMSKSTGNFITLRDLIDEVGPSTARYALMDAHYRTQADFSMDKVKSLKTRYDRLTRIYHFGRQQMQKSGLSSLEGELRSYTNSEINETIKNFDNALSDDLNTPQAFAALYDLEKIIEKIIAEEYYDQLSEALHAFEKMFDVFGIPLISLSDDEVSYVNTIVNHRLDLRAEKKFQEADAIRDYLQFSGYQLNDTSKTSTEWFKPERP